MKQKIMGKVTYLLGAGASIQSIPSVEGMKNGIEEMQAILNSHNSGTILNEKIEGTSVFYGHIIDELIADFVWMINACDSHASIDTFAKKLFISTQPKESQRLKAALTAYFTLIQIVKPLDKRYDAFFASLLNQFRILPKGLNIISWNYDNQFEKAFSGFGRITSLDEIHSSMSIKLKNDQASSQIAYSNVFKLNGSAFFIDRGNSPWLQFMVDNIFEGLSEIAFKQILANYFRIKKSVAFSGLSFAWEEEQTNGNKIWEKAVLTCKDTETLVVIGYSFPFYNKEIDTKILQEFKQLKKVYIQDPDFENIKERLQEINIGRVWDEVKIISKMDKKLFFIPNEL